MTKKQIAVLMLEKITSQLPRRLKIFSATGYQGKDFAQALKDNYQLNLAMLQRYKQSKGFGALLGQDMKR